MTIVTIACADIDRRNTNAALVSLNKLVESKAALEQSNGTISLLVSGYEQDLRELHTIPELRGYVKHLNATFLYWFHIGTRIEHSLWLIFLLLADLAPVASPEKSVNVQFANDDLHPFLERHFQAMDSMHEKYGFSAEEDVCITELVMNYSDSLIGR